VGEQIERLWRAGFLAQSVRYQGTRIANLHHRGDVPMVPAAVNPSERLRISAQASVRYQRGGAIVESTASGSYVQVMAEGLSWLTLPISDSTDCIQWARAAAQPVPVMTALSAWLRQIGALEACDHQISEPERGLGWSFADRMMHARSRKGRHVGGYGGTFRFVGLFSEPPAVKNESGRSCIHLPESQLEEIIKRDPPFTEVFESRRSIRQHGSVPPTLDRLGEFLYRTCRVKRQAVSQERELALRPYPSAGGCHELEIYPLINQCAGIDSGLYRYDGSTHSLLHVAEPGPNTAELINDARQCAMMTREPHILLLISARFLRVSWKYESLAYSLTLKNVGVLFQSMYLVATAMGLAPCALGGGPSDSLSRLINEDFWQESAVGEFLLGEPSPN